MPSSVKDFQTMRKKTMKVFGKHKFLPSSLAFPWLIDECVVVRLLESLYILDCYRVIIMQIPPSLSWHHVDSIVQSLPPDSQMAQLQHVVAGLTGPAHSRTDSSFLDRFSMASLASLSPYLWPAIYPHQNRHYNNDNNGLISEGLSSWKADFIELACDDWLRTS